MANFKLESGLRIRVTILDRRRRQRDNAYVNAANDYLDTNKVSISTYVLDIFE